MLRNIQQFGLIILLIFSSLSLVAQPEIRVDLDYKQASLESVLLDLEQRFPIQFSYDPSLISGKQVRLRVDQMDIERAFQLIFDPLGLPIEWSSDQLVLILPPEPNQTGRIYHLCGRILEKQSLEALIGVTIRISGTSTGCLSQVDGSFQLPGIYDLNVPLEVSYLGYQNIQIAARELFKTNCPTLYLDFESNELQTVIVREYLTEGIASGDLQNEIVLDPDQMKTLPGLVEPDVLLMTQMLPGIGSADESATGINVRGGTPDQNLILYDGIPIYNSGHFFGMISAFNPYILEEVEVFRSGFDASYGGRVSSVINIQSENEIASKASFGVGSNLTHYFGYGQIPFARKKASVIFSFRRSLTDLFQSPTYNRLFNRVFQLSRIDDQIGEVDDNFNSAVVDFYYYDMNVKVLLKPSEKDDLSISLISAFNKLNYRFEDFYSELFTQDVLDLENNGLSINWKRKWSDQLSHETLISWADYGSEYAFQLEFDTLDIPVYDAEIKNRLEDFNFGQSFTLKINEFQELDFGYQFDYKDLGLQLSFESLVEEDFFDDFLQEGSSHILHGNYRYESGPVKANVGLRLNYLPFLKKAYAEPRFYFSYKASDQAIWHISGGWYTQFVSQLLETSNLEVSDQYWVLADNEGIPVIQGTQISGGGHFTFGDVQLNVEAYFKRTEGIISLSPNFRFSPDQPYDQGVSDVLGFDVLLRKNWGKSKSWISYAFSDVDYTFSVVNGGQSFPAFHEQPHQVQFVHQHNINDWSISMGWKFASGLPFTRPDGVRQDEENPEQLFLTYGVRNDQRLRSYHRLDLSILYKVHSKAFQKGSGRIGLSLLNLYDRRNTYARNFYIEVGDQEPELAEVERSLLGFTPNLSVQWEF